MIVEHHARHGLILHTSNRLESLASRLAALLRSEPAPPFEAEVIIVQSQGMARWLQLELATRLGLCANVRFPFPRTFAREVFRAFDPAGIAPADFRADPAQFTWQVWHLLPWLGRQPVGSPIQRYLDRDPDGRKRYQLASRIARLFDDYAVFRPDLVLRWDDGGPAASDPEADRHPWQAILWRKLGEIAGPDHAARQHTRFVQRLEDAKEGAAAAPPPGLPRRVCLFGISSLPPFHVDLFERLTPWCSIHCFLLQPAAVYWGDVTSAKAALRRASRASAPARASELHRHEGNPLLASLGGQGRDFLNVLLAQTDFNNLDAFTEPGDDSLLHSIQSDLLHLRNPGAAGVPDSEDGEGAAARAVIRSDDDSLTVHSCHSPLRELEVLHDHVLHWLSADPTLTPRDILVMTPDIETYAPFIDAVFAGLGRGLAVARGGEKAGGIPFLPGPDIPYSVADRGSGSQSQILGTFVRILSLAGSRLGVASVVELLDTPAVRRRFGFGEADVWQAREWLQAAGVRWGRDEAHRLVLGLPALRQNTWAEGLDRLLLGYAMNATGDRLFEGILPCDAAEGQACDVLAHLLEFVQQLLATLTILEQMHPLAAWADILRKLVSDFFAEAEQDEPEHRLLREILAELEPPDDASPIEEPFSLAVVLEHLGPILADDRIRGGFLAGGVTFGALKPMRSIPFRIICLLGLNDSDFPRADARLAFDLMAAHPRLGDQSKRDDDRYLFLETLLSARDRLHLSYVGQSIRDNSPAPPSVLVSELLDYIDQGYVLSEAPPGQSAERSPSQRFVHHHRLQAFSADYFGLNPQLFSYSGENLRAAQALRHPVPPAGFVSRPLPEPGDEWRTVDLDRLSEFFTRPAHFFLTRRLDLLVPRPESDLSEREPMELKGLDAYQIKTEILEKSLAGHDLAALRPLYVAGGRLPLGRLGVLRYEQLAGDVAEFRQRLNRFRTDERLVAPEMDLAIDQFRVVGRFPHLTPDGLLHFRPGAISAKDRVRAWVQHVAWCAAAPNGLPRLSVMLGEPGKGSSSGVRKYKALDAETAQVHLHQLLKVYWRGLSEPLRFFPRTSLKFAELDLARNDHSGDPSEESIQKARAEWDGNEFQDGEGINDSFQLCFGHIDPLDADFIMLAREIGRPMLEYEERKRR